MLLPGVGPSSLNTKNELSDVQTNRAVIFSLANYVHCTSTYIYLHVCKRIKWFVRVRHLIREKSGELIQFLIIR